MNRKYEQKLYLAVCTRLSVTSSYCVWHWRIQSMFITPSLHSRLNWRRIVVSVHVCLCVAVRKHISGTTCAILSKFPVHVKCDRSLLAALRHVMYFLSHLDTVAANDVIASNCKVQATAPNASYRYLVFQSYTMAVTESGRHAKCTGSLQRITVLTIRVTVHCWHTKVVELYYNFFLKNRH